jgi:hypothetical protein
VDDPHTTISQRQEDHIRAYQIKLKIPLPLFVEQQGIFYLSRVVIVVVECAAELLHVYHSCNGSQYSEWRK